MIYNFQCRTCQADLEVIFAASEYDNKVTADNRLKRKKCEKCNSISFYRHIIEAPSVLGGNKGYVSMERWQQNNPDHAKKHEEELKNKMEDRHRKRVLNKINKQIGGDRSEDRHKDYGSGKEEKLDSND